MGSSRGRPAQSSLKNGAKVLCQLIREIFFPSFPSFRKNQ
jgi:hypothetical protein